MMFRAATAGDVTGTGSIVTTSAAFGGALITADGTNDCVVIVREDDASGQIIFDITTKNSMWCLGAYRGNGGTKTFYYSISGTGGSAMLYEYQR